MCAYKHQNTSTVPHNLDPHMQSTQTAHATHPQLCNVTHNLACSISEPHAGDWISPLSVWLSWWFALSGHSALVTSVFTSLTESGWISLPPSALKGLFTGGGCNHYRAYSTWSDKAAGCHILCVCVCVCMHVCQWRDDMIEAMFTWLLVGFLLWDIAQNVEMLIIYCRRLIMVAGLDKCQYLLFYFNVNDRGHSLQSSFCV